MAKIREGTIKHGTNAEILSMILNTQKEEMGDIELPVQGASVAKYGEIILGNYAYKNAFLNAINMIALTVIKKNGWENPWNFCIRGNLTFGQQIREMIVDMVDAYDYNENYEDKDKFLEEFRPKVYQYIHEINFQKWYPVSINDQLIMMAFQNESDGLLTLIEESYGKAYESYIYHEYILNKYMLCRRILSGTVPAVPFTDWATLSKRERVSSLKSVSNKMTFRNPNYNMCNLKLALPTAEQILIVDTDFEAEYSTEVLATSYFKDEAELRARLRLIDGFASHDETELAKLIGDSYVPFTSAEKTALGKIKGVIISEKWFMDYNRLIDGQTEYVTEFRNPTTLTNTRFMHIWRVFSTSPFEVCAVITDTAGSVSSVTVSPATATLPVGAELQLSASVSATFASKDVIWTSSDETKAKVDKHGRVTAIASTASGTVTITAKSVADGTKTDTCVITITS